MTSGQEIIRRIGRATSDARLRDPVVETEMLVTRQISSNVSLLVVTDLKTGFLDESGYALMEELRAEDGQADGLGPGDR